MIDGIPVNEFCALVDIVTKKHGKGVMISSQDKEGKMHLTKRFTGLKKGTTEMRHLGYIDLKTGSLVWDDCQ